MTETSVSLVYSPSPWKAVPETLVFALTLLVCAVMGGLSTQLLVLNRRLLPLCHGDTRIGSLFFQLKQLRTYVYLELLSMALLFLRQVILIPLLWTPRVYTVLSYWVYVSLLLGFHLYYVLFWMSVAQVTFTWAVGQQLTLDQLHNQGPSNAERVWDVLRLLWVMGSGILISGMMFVLVVFGLFLFSNVAITHWLMYWAELSFRIMRTIAFLALFIVFSALFVRLQRINHVLVSRYALMSSSEVLSGRPSFFRSALPWILLSMMALLMLISVYSMVEFFFDTRVSHGAFFIFAMFQLLVELPMRGLLLQQTYKLHKTYLHSQKQQQHQILYPLTDALSGPVHRTNQGGREGPGQCALGTYRGQYDPLVPDQAHVLRHDSQYALDEQSFEF